MNEELERVSKKKNQILHTLKGLAETQDAHNRAMDRQLDRLMQDVEELCAMRKQQKEGTNGDS